MENAGELRQDGAAGINSQGPDWRGAGTLGVGATDIVTSRSGNHLVLRLRNGTHSLTLHDYFRKNAEGAYVRDEVRLVDGMLWNLRAWCAKAEREATAME
ncbi:hypothetical protein [Pantoea sp. 18069]|uniref:hypothetical protein n=1 Tax=Pantoea sp. 18069 TaxID=2681415 RepID=UPI001358E566|nr:hypothetical protein [Pantoea sp. 18069]